MATIKKSISIEAPVAKVFEYVNHPENFPTYWPSMVEVKNIKQNPEGGRSFDFVYKMAGFKFEGHSDSVEYKDNKRVVSKTGGAVPAKFEWDFGGKDGLTELTVTCEYTMPGNLVSKLAEPILVRLNDREAETMLANLKSTLEGEKLRKTG